jgi:hypothetical protein
MTDDVWLGPVKPGELTQADGDRRSTTPAYDRCRQMAYHATVRDGPFAPCKRQVSGSNPLTGSQVS